MSEQVRSAMSTQEQIETVAYQARMAARHRPCPSARPCSREFPAMPSRWCNGCLIAALLAEPHEERWQQEWRAIPGNERYEVSNDGHVRVARGIEVGQWMTDQGYMLVRLSQPRCLARVHRLVAMAFLPNPNNLPGVNHKDSVRSNNHVTNLEWCTQQENLAHANGKGRMQHDHWIGKRSPSAKLTDDQVREMRSIYAAGGHAWSDLAKRYGIGKRSVGRILRRELYTDI